MKLEELASGQRVDGVEPSSVVLVVAAVAIPPDSLRLVYRLPDGSLREHLLSRVDEPSLSLATLIQASSKNQSVKTDCRTEWRSEH